MKRQFWCDSYLTAYRISKLLVYGRRKIQFIGFLPLAFLHNASIFLKSNVAHVTFKYMNPRLDQLQFLHRHVTKNNDHYIQRISLNSISY